MNTSGRQCFFIALLFPATLVTACGDAPTDKDLTSRTVSTQTVSNTSSAASVPPSQRQNTPTSEPPVNRADSQILAPGIDAASLGANLNGSGSTLVSPALKIWQQEFGKLFPKVRINYQAGGSGQGRSDLLTGKTEFGVSDVQVSKEEASKTGHNFDNYIQIPATLAAIVLIYHVPGVSNLKLDPQVLGEIYTGKIKKWNDQKITHANPDANLPDAEIKFAVRADSSGTSEVFVTYLAEVSADFKAKIGKPSGTPKWENVGINVTAASGNDGIAGLVKQSEGCLGYTELAFALQNKLSYATLKNKAGTFVQPTLDTLSAAATDAKPDEHLKVNLVDQPEQNAYPITTTTYFLLNRRYEDKAQGQAVVAFVWFALHRGGELAKKANYAPLSDELLKQAEEKLRNMTTDSVAVAR